MDSIHTIELRDAELDREVARLTARLKEIQEEKAENATARRVLLRLSGESGPTSSPITEPEKTQIPQKRTIPQMIRETLYANPNGLTPKEMADYLNLSNVGQSISVQTTNSVAWKMWKSGKLEKTDNVYSLPANEKPADAVPAEAASTGFDPETQSRPVKPVPGGGA